MEKLKSLLLLLTLLVSLPAFSQKLTVRDFDARPQDMDAIYLKCFRSDGCYLYPRGRDCQDHSC
ncbi:MAG: hypothetical protein K2N35_17710 [Muribaculaceae bacterium]|nr:hypothetical protein [Muribaculaceae bacterium]